DGLVAGAPTGGRRRASARRGRAGRQRGAEGGLGVTIRVPTPVRAFVGGREAVRLEGGSVGELLDRLTGEHAPLRPHLFSDDGRLRSFVNVYVNDRDIRQLAQRDTPVKAGDTVSIIPSIAGGTAVADVLP